MATDLIASRLMVRNAAKALDDEAANHVSLCAAAKQFSTDKCFNVSFSVSLYYKVLSKSEWPKIMATLFTVLSISTS